MRLLFAAYIGFAAIGLAATDYSEITTFTGPCARELAVMAKEGDIKSARDQVQALCRSETARACPDLWLVYAYCEIKLMSPNALKVSKELIKRLPNSAPAHMIHAIAIGLDGGSGGIIRLLRRLGPMRQAMEMAVGLDPDCHPARIILISLYDMPGLLGGDEAKVRNHLAELDRRDPYYSALVHGELEADKKNYTAAMTFIQEAQRLQPDKREPERRLVKLNAAMGNYEEAFALCSTQKSLSESDGTDDDLFVELSMRSGLHMDEALAASMRYLAAPHVMAPIERATVLVNTAIVLKRLGRNEESAHMVAEAETLWAGADKMFRLLEKEYLSKRRVVAAR